MPALPHIGFVGLGAMGIGMATYLVKSGYSVSGFDMNPAATSSLASAGGTAAISPVAAATAADVFIIMVATADQCNSVLFETATGTADSAVKALPKNAIIILCSTVPPGYPAEALERVRHERPDVQFLDCPVSGGTVRAGKGDLVILASGDSSTLQSNKVKAVLDTMASSLHVIPGGLGAANKVKLINQQLAGIHIAATAEAMALGAVLGMDMQALHDAVVKSDAWSWMFENRGMHIVKEDWTPHSALDIFVKDMGIVTAQGRIENFPLPLSSIAEQLYLAGHNMGLGRQDDSSLYKYYVQSRGGLLQRSNDDTSSTQLILGHLQSIHLVATVEALSLAAKMELNLDMVVEIIGSAAGGSHVFKEEAPRLVAGGSGSKLSMKSLRKALMECVEMARKSKIPTPLAAGALQLYQLGQVKEGGVDNLMSLAALWQKSTPAGQTLLEKVT